MPKTPPPAAPFNPLTAPMDAVAREAERRLALRRQGLPLTAPTPDAEHSDCAEEGHAPDDGIVRNPHILEKEEQHECYKVFRAFGCTVWNLSQARETKQTPGLGDAFITHPDRGLAFWWETKRQVGGGHSPAQLEFRRHCLDGRVMYYTGDRFHAQQTVVDLGLAERLAGGTLHPRPFPPQ